MQDAMTVRRCTVEHVFGTFKGWMGTTPFLTRRLPNVSTEMSLTVLAYNLKRILSILGFAETMKAVQMVGAYALCCRSWGIWSSQGSSRAPPAASTRESASAGSESAKFTARPVLQRHRGEFPHSLDPNRK